MDWKHVPPPNFFQFHTLKQTLGPFFNKTCKETEDKLRSAWSMIICISLRFNLFQVKQRSIKYRRNFKLWPEGKIVTLITSP